MRESRFQIDIATGRFTLPVAIFLCLILWLFTRNDWYDLASLIAISATGYLMIETNTTFTLIRTRTTFQVSIYFLLVTSLLFLHPFEWSNLIPLIFMIIVFQLFQSYESPDTTTSIYHTFLFISLGSIVFPSFICYIPFILGSMVCFRSIHLKTLTAGILGFLTPYWFILGYAFYSNQIPVFYEPLLNTIRFYPIDYSIFPLNEWCSWGIVTILSIVSSWHYLMVAYKDKSRTRIYLTFFVIANIWTILFCLLQPLHLHELLQIQVVCTSILCGHLFSLTRNRFSSIFFIVTFILFILLTFYNIWTLFFSF